MTTWSGGYTATTYYDAHLEAVRRSIENYEEEKEIIVKNKEELVMPIETGPSDIADFLPDFYAGRTCPDWLTIPRNNPGILQD